MRLRQECVSRLTHLITHSAVSKHSAAVRSQLNNCFLIITHKLAAVICRHIQGDEGFITSLLFIDCEANSF